MKAKNPSLSQQQKKRDILKKIRICFFALLLSVLLIFTYIVLRPYDVEIYTSTDGISNAIASLQPKAIELNNISVKTQPTPTTCGITTVTIISNYFNNTDYEANDLIEKYSITAGGASDSDLMEWLREELPERTIAYKSNGTDEEMIRDIHASLNDNSPVMISFAAPNPYNEPYYDFHGSVVFGIDLDNETIMIANSYGYIEAISLVDFLNRMSFTEIDKFPLGHRFMMKIKGVDRNGYHIV
jgi:hypothetical protein